MPAQPRTGRQERHASPFNSVGLARPHGSFASYSTPRAASRAIRQQTGRAMAPGHPNAVAMTAMGHAAARISPCIGVGGVFDFDPL